MRPGRLYIKIFISFILVLIVTEALIFGLFVFSVGRGFRSRFEQYTGAQVLIAKEMVEEKIRSRPETDPSENKSLKDFVSRLGQGYGAKVWLTGEDGAPILKSFPGDVSDEIALACEQRGKDMGDFKMYREFKRGHIFYIETPVEVQKDRLGSLHILFEKMEAPYPEAGFALGLIGIGVVIALLIIPVSRRITEPVKQLKASAVRIAEGDLSHRATVKSKDEIGELGRSFNHMAEKQEKMIRGGRELTANISHELRSPLARIRIAEELLKEKWERGDYKDLEKHLDGIREDIEVLDHRIGSILVLSKLDIHEEPLKLEPLNLSGLIDGLVKRLEPVINRKGLHLMTELSCDSPVMGNMDGLKTALSNILDNAVKFTAEKGHVIIKMYSENEFLRISITNSFEELSAEDLARIFEPFFRTEQSPAGGSGLGLAIAKKIMEKHGGSIKASSSEKGFQIEVALPIAGKC